MGSTSSSLRWCARFHRFGDVRRKDRWSQMATCLPQRTFASYPFYPQSLRPRRYLILVALLHWKSAYSVPESLGLLLVFPLARGRIFHPWCLVVLGIRQPYWSQGQTCKSRKPVSSLLIPLWLSPRFPRWFERKLRPVASFHTCFRFFRGR